MDLCLQSPRKFSVKHTITFLFRIEKVSSPVLVFFTYALTQKLQSLSRLLLLELCRNNNKLHPSGILNVNSYSSQYSIGILSGCIHEFGLPLTSVFIIPVRYATMFVFLFNTICGDGRFSKTSRADIRVNDIIPVMLPQHQIGIQVTLTICTILVHHS